MGPLDFRQIADIGGQYFDAWIRRGELDERR